MEEGTEDVVPVDIISDEIRLQARSTMQDKTEKIQQYFKFQDMGRTKVFDLLNKGYLKDVNVTYDMRKIIDEMLKDISSTGAKYMNSLMFKSEETYILDHSINTAVMAVLVGQRYRFSKSELTDLALGCYLHDFGKIIIERMKGSSSGSSAEELMREHPTFGYLMIRNSQDTSPIVSQIINQHHENQDGSGYPIGLSGQNLPPVSSQQRETKGQIFRLAEICSVVNAYDNLLMSTNGGKVMAPSDAMKQLVLDAGSKYNKDVVQVLTKIVPHFPVGAFVKIENIVDPTLIGCTGVVAKLNEHNLNKPTIIVLYDRLHNRIKPRKVDTAKLKHIELQLLL
jgi:HD-GYP domain-containing protein (c-di-GMP phosphodiesterase class II)